MKQFSQAVAVVAVSTICAGAFTAIHNDQQATRPAAENQAAQIVVTGKRMTAMEKSEFDAGIILRSAASADRIRSDEFRLAVK